MNNWLWGEPTLLSVVFTFIAIALVAAFIPIHSRRITAAVAQEPALKPDQTSKASHFVIRTPTSPFQTRLPQEIIQFIFAYIHPSHVMRFRRLCRQTNSALSTRGFAALNLSLTVDQTLSFKCARNNSSDSDSDIATEVTVRNTAMTDFDRLWFMWPATYQFYYAEKVLSKLTKIKWEDPRLKRMGTRFRHSASASFRKLPHAVGGLTQLKCLILTYMNLQGGVVSSLGNLIHLHTLSLACNRLSGPLPAELLQLIHLKVLNLSFNQLDGPIPRGISDLSQLTSLKLNDNRFTGSIPEQMGSLDQLNLLDLGNNELTGNLPSQVGNLRNVYYLDFSRNLLEGSIPCTFGNLEHLRYLLLHENQMQGEIPFELGQLEELDMISLKGNDLRIPQNAQRIQSFLWQQIRSETEANSMSNM
ncbi:hypothetical protein HDU80_002202 [Chytriomyces hyalinus]|nr:hypothetical protein HDU80_002202 [Chytriomyces hyalinus]